MTIIYTILFIILVLISPTPLSLYLAKRIEANSPLHPSLARTILLSLALWSIIQTSIALALGFCHLYNYTSVIITYITINITSLFSKKIRQQIIAIQHASTAASTLIHTLSLGELVIILFFSFYLVAIFLTNTTHPIKNFDSLTYHLPNMVSWIQNAHFSMVDHIILNQANRYPYNWQAFTGFFLMPGGNDILATLPNMIALLILWLAIFCLSIRLGATRLNSLFAATLATTFPLQITLINSVMIDIPFAAFYLVFVYFLVLFAQSRYPTYLLCSLIFGGMLIGIKINGPILFIATAVSALVTLPVCQCIIHPRRNSLRLRHILVISIFFILLAFPWYLRNWFELGNPFGYIPISFGNIVIFPGLEYFSLDFLRSTSLLKVFNINNPTHWQIILDQISSRLGLPLFTLLYLISPAVGVFMPAAETRNNRRVLLFIIILIICSLYLYIITPFSGSLPPSIPNLHPWVGWNFRYTYPTLALLASISALGATKLMVPRFIVVILTMTSCALAIRQLEISPIWQIISLILITTIASFFYSTSKNNFVFKAKRKVPFVPIITALLVISFSLSIYTANKTRENIWNKAYTDIPRTLAKTLSPNESIGFLDYFRIYPLFGKNLKRRVIDVRKKAENYNDWLEFLKQEEIGCIIFEPFREGDFGDSKEITWLKQSQTPYKRITTLNSSSANREILLYCRNNNDPVIK